MYAMVPSSRMGQRQREAWGIPNSPGVARQGGSEQFKTQFYHASDVGNSPLRGRHFSVPIAVNIDQSPQRRPTRAKETVSLRFTREGFARKQDRSRPKLGHNQLWRAAVNMQGTDAPHS